MAGKSSRTRIPLFPVPPLSVEPFRPEDSIFYFPEIRIAEERSPTSPTKQKTYRDNQRNSNLISSHKYSKAQYVGGPERSKNSKKVTVICYLFSRQSTELT